VTGTWIGVDVGTVRVGVARSDAAGILASPLTTLNRDTSGNTDVAELAVLVRESGAVGVVIGLPTTLKGREGPSALMAREYGERLARLVDVPVRHVDERLTTVSAQRKLRQGGIRGSKATRAVIDQAAAVELLQHWLEILRAERGGTTGVRTHGPERSSQE
jgi:putative Holliday junction resolvase